MKQTARRVVAPYGAGIRLPRRCAPRNDKDGSACKGASGMPSTTKDETGWRETIIASIGRRWIRINTEINTVNGYVKRYIFQAPTADPDEDVIGRKCLTVYFMAVIIAISTTVANRTEIQAVAVEFA